MTDRIHSMSEIKQFLETEGLSLVAFDEYLNSCAELAGEVVNDYIPQNTHPEIDRYLYSPLKEYSKNGGKRHRPLICFAACRAVGGDVMKAMSAASAIEHFHTAALIHDDIADCATLRRGLPCLHITQGEQLAMNMGDLELLLVGATLIRDDDLDDHLKVRIAQELTDMTQRTMEGQALDIGWACDKRFDITVDDYLLMASHKTAYYSGSIPLAVGAIIGGGSKGEIEALRKFGFDTGLAFQIQDDLLNLIGSEESTKKDFRSDITEGKRTLMVVHALEHASTSLREELIAILSSNTQDEEQLAKAVEILEQTGSVDFARKYAEELVCSAKKCLVENIQPTDARDLLESMADWFVKRLR